MLASKDINAQAQTLLGQTGAASASFDRHISLPVEPAQLEISNRFYAAADATSSKTIADMTREQFTPLAGVFLAGYSAKAHWLRFTVSDPLERTREWWLELEPPFIDEVDLYESLGSDVNGTLQFRHVKTGDTRAISTREVPNQSFVFQISPRAQPTTYYVRLKSSGPIWTGARIWHSSVFVGYSVRYAHMQAAAYGAFLLFMLITLVQGLIFKDMVYLAFVAHVGAVLLGQASIILPLYLPEGWLVLIDVLPTFGICLSVATYAIFCNYFVLSVQKNRIYAWSFFVLTAVGLAGALACISPAYRWIVPGILAAKIIGSVLPVVAVSRQLMRGSLFDRLVWLGLVLYVPAQALLLWRLTSVAQQSAFWNTLHIYTGILLLHMLLITFALGERLSRITRASRVLAGQMQTERLLKELADRTAFDQRSFLSMVAHELGRPLVASRSASHELRQLATASGTGEVIHRIDHIETLLQQMASLVSVCLTHEREGFAQPLSLNLSMTLEHLRSRVHEVLTDITAAHVRWPDSQDDEPIICSPALLAIAVRNMIENACRHDTTGGIIDITWQVVVGQTRALDGWQICVLDRGPQIPPEQLDRLFEPSARSDQAKGSSLELGWYLVSRIASMHGAKANAQPRGGGGMVYSITYGA